MTLIGDRVKGSCTTGIDSASFQERFYDEEFDYHVGSPHLTYLPLREKIADVIVGEVRSLSERRLPLRVAEIGAGHGEFTEPLLAAGCEVTATESSDASTRALSQRFGPNPRFTPLYAPDGSFDQLSCDYSLITCVSVLHHIVDYLAALDELVQRVRPGGSLITFQDPLLYNGVRRRVRRLDRLGYVTWRLGQGNFREGLRTQARRLRGSYDDSEPADMVEYHVVRQGMDERAIVELLERHFGTVSVIRYWSNHSVAFQRLGDRMGVANTFGVVATDRRS